MKSSKRTRLALAAALLLALGGTAVAVPNALASWKARNERRAIGALRDIADAQALFREADLDQDGHWDYGSLEELVAGGVLDEEFLGELHGYRFESHASTRTPEFMWLATAKPCDPGFSGGRWFGTNHQGSAYVSGTPFSLDAVTCQPPEDVPET